MSFSYIDDYNDINFCKVNNLCEWLKKQTMQCETNKLNFVELNVRSICKYWDLFHVYFKDCLNHIDILMLCETAIRRELVNLYNIPGFKSYHYCRNHKSGGGILLYVKNNLSFSQIFLDTKYFENVFGILTLPNNSTLNVLAIYRPPNLNKQAFLSEISMVFENNIKSNESVIFFGDVNLNLLKKMMLSL